MYRNLYTHFQESGVSICGGLSLICRISFLPMRLRSTDSDFDVRRSESPAKTVGLCSLCQPYALLMEVTGYTPWKLEERLKIRDEVKQQSPHCKIVLIVDENAEKKLAQCVLQAKKDGLIDNFIYGSISASYLTAVIDTL